MTTSSTTTNISSSKSRSRLALIVLAYIAFIALGLPDGLLGVAWPSIRDNFALPLDALGMLLAAGTVGYLTSSFFSGQLMNRMGVGGLLAASCAATGLALLGYTLVPAWWMYVLLGVVGGLGAGAIDAGLNTYMASHFDEGLMQWLHASYGVGITGGPLIMTAGLAWFSAWRWGYQVVGIAQLALAALFVLTLAMWRNTEHVADARDSQRLTDYRTPILDTLRQPMAWLSLALFFLYVGIEVTLGHWAYTLLTEGRGIPVEVAGLWAGSYWGTFTLGRMLAGLYTKRLSVHSLVRLSLLGALAGTLLLAWNPFPFAGLLAVVLVGFSVAPIFPGMMSGTEERVGAAHAANTIGMQLSATGLAVAVLPGLAGALARRTSLEIIPLYLAALIVLLLGLYSGSIRHHKKQS